MFYKQLHTISTIIALLACFGLQLSVCSSPTAICANNRDCHNRGPCIIGVCDKRTSRCQYKMLEDGESCFGFEDLSVYWETQCTPTCQEQTCVAETLNCPPIACNDQIDVAVVVQRGLTKDTEKVHAFMKGSMDRVYASGKARFAFLNFEAKKASLTSHFNPPGSIDLTDILETPATESSVKVALETTSDYFENYSRPNSRRILFLFFKCEYLLDEELVSLSNQGIEVFTFGIGDTQQTSCANMDAISSVPLLKHSFIGDTSALLEFLPDLIDDSCLLEYKEKRQVGTPDCVNNPTDVCCSGSQVITCPLSACGEAQICVSGVGCQVDVPLDCSHLGDQCNTPVCDTNNPGSCTVIPLDGTNCDDGDECTELDTCSNGVCEPGFRMDCSCMEDSDVDPCVEASCINGICQMVNLPENTTCIDMDRIGEPATCIGGVCSTICGNGILDSGELCDDNNVGLCCATSCDSFQNQGARCNFTSCFQTYCENGTCVDLPTPLPTATQCDEIPGGCCDGAGSCTTCNKRSMFGFGSSTRETQTVTAKKDKREDDDEDFSFDSYGGEDVEVI